MHDVEIAKGRHLQALRALYAKWPHMLPVPTVETVAQEEKPAPRPRWTPEQLAADNAFDAVMVRWLGRELDHQKRTQAANDALKAVSQ